MSSQQHSTRSGVHALLGAYGLLGSAFVAAFCFARAAGDWGLNVQSRSLQLLVAATVVATAVSATLLAVAYRRAGDRRRFDFWLPVLMAAVTVAFGLGLAESAVRLLSRPNPLGLQVGQTALLPYDWDALRAANLSLLDRHESATAYYVPDSDLGWSIGASRVNDDGLYKSSAEGLRSAESGVRLSERPGVRVALFGDSFTFSEEVPFEESLGRHLGDVLGDAVHVLNFGVPGYGVDQAVLRFMRDGVAWSPRVAVLAFIEDDLRRTVNLYTFMKASWATPLSKPRFISTESGLELRNSPTMPPREIFAASSVFDLPLLEYEVEFFAHDWIEHPLHASRLLRYLVSKFPIWPTPNPLTSDDEIVSISVRLIEAFRDGAEANGASPIVVYLPSAGSLEAERDRPLKSRVIRELAGRGMQVHDLTSCIYGKIDVADLYLAGGHYTDEGNAATAQCLSPFVAAALDASAR